MKKILSFVLILLTALLPLACGKKSTDSSKNVIASPTATVIALTSTPTISLTPVWGFTHVKMPDVLVDISNPNPVILRNMEDWTTFYSGPNGQPILLTPVALPTPPVNFAKQMLVVIIKPPCPISILSIVSVCEGATGVTINLNSQEVCEVCHKKGMGASVLAVAIPQSDQLQVWNTNNLPCKETKTDTTP